MSEHADESAGWIDTPSREVEAAWIDYNGHMNSAFYALAFDQSLDVVLEDSFGIGATYATECGRGPYVVQNHIHYLAELLKGEIFRVRLRLVDADAKRLHCFMEMVRERDGAVVATSEQLLLHVDLHERRSVPFAGDRYERTQFVLRAHADYPRPDRLGAPLGIRRPAGAGTKPVPSAPTATGAET